MKHLSIALVATLLCSCAVQRAQVASEAKDQMIGLSKERVLACMGPPGQRMAEGATEVWAYQSGDGTVLSASSGSATAYGGMGSAQIYGSASGVSSRRFCQVNVVMSGGVVSQINYQGPTGGLLTAGEQCAFVVQSCVKH